jgi:acetyl esterase/lipase
VCRNYLGCDSARQEVNSLADPLLLLEDSSYESARPLPPFHVFCGTRDPLLDDTRRLATALRQRNVMVDAQIYPGGVHDFHVLAFQRIARQCWRRQLQFLERQLAPEQQNTEEYHSTSQRIITGG